MKKARRLNDEQLLVIDARGYNCMVAAIPGAGKTGVITEKSGRLLRQSITVSAVTFTRSAAAELYDRVCKAVGPQFLDGFTSGTFHGQILEVLRQSPEKQLSGLRIASNSEVARVMDAELKHAGLKASKANRKRLEAASAKLKDPFGIEAASKSIDNGESTDEEFLARARSLSLVAERMDRRLRELGVISMSAITRMGLEHVRSGRPVFPGRYILVDEGQDMDEVQLEVVLEHLKLGAIIDVVGDDDQSVYGFREGLGFDGLERFKFAARAEPIQLNVNYRSHQEILDLAGEVIVQNTKRLPKLLQSDKGPGGTTGLVYWEDNQSEAQGVTTWIQRILAKSSPEVRIGVIARHNWLLDGMEDAIGDLIPFVRVQNDSFWDEPLVGAVLSFLRCVADPERERAGIEQLLLVWGADLAGIDILRAEGGSQAIGNLIHCWRPEFSAAAAETCRAMTWLAQLCQAVGYPERPVTDQAIAGAFSAANATLVAAAKACGCLAGKQSESIESEIRKIDAAFRSLGRLSGPLARRIATVTMAREAQEKCSLRLMTVHGSKGLEFDHVFVIGCEDETIPGRFAQDEELEEERRLMYVAITRAMENLVLSYPRRVQRRNTDRAATKSSILTSIKSLKEVSGAELPMPWSSNRRRISYAEIWASSSGK